MKRMHEEGWNALLEGLLISQIPCSQEAAQNKSNKSVKSRKNGILGRHEGRLRLSGYTYIYIYIYLCIYFYIYIYIYTYKGVCLGATCHTLSKGVVLPTLVCFSGTSIFFLLVWSTAMLGSEALPALCVQLDLPSFRFGSGSPTLGILFPFVYLGPQFRSTRSLAGRLAGLLAASP